MYQSSVRSTTASSAKTAIALVAILSLLLSLFAIVQPAIAHEGGTDVPLGNAQEGGIPANHADFLDNEECPDLAAGTGLFHFVLNQVDGELEAFEASFDLDGDGAADVTYTLDSENVDVTSNPSGNYSINVTTDDDAVLISATAHVTGADSDANLRLSHTCFAEDLENEETVTVIKDLVGDTAGTFNLMINGTVHTTGGDGATTGAIVTAEGSVTVSESAANTTDLADYTSSITCVAGETVLVDAQPGTAATFNLGDNQDVVCTITNTLIVEDTGDLKVIKYFCEGTNDPQVVFVPLEEGTTLPNLEDCVEGDATFAIDGGDSRPTTEGVLLVPGLSVGAHTLAELTPNEASTDFTIVANTETVIYVLNYEDQPDQGEIQIDKFFCPTEGEDRVEFDIRGPISSSQVDGGDDCRVGGGITFIVTPVDPAGDPFEVTTLPNGTIRFDATVGTYTVTEKSTGATSDVFNVELGALTVIIVINFEGEEQPETGNVEVIKVGECAECETFTRGGFFGGTGGFPDEETTNALFGEEGITLNIGGTDVTFFDADDVRAFEGDSPQQTQLTVQVLTLLLNIAINEDCDLLNATLNGTTVEAIRDAALAALSDPEATGNELSAHIELVTAINEGGSEFECSVEGGELLDGAMFDLYFDTNESGVLDEGDALVDEDLTTTEGVLSLTGLPVGTYFLVETQAPEGCETPEGEDAVTTITVEAGETTRVTITNDCDVIIPPPPGGEGLLEIEKFFCPADEDGTQFIVSDPAPLENLRTLQEGEEEAEGCSTGDATFRITNNETDESITVSTGADGLVEVELADGEYTITETSTDELPAPSATFTVEDGSITAVIVINSEAEEEEEGQVKIIKLFCDAAEDSVTFTIEGGDQLPPSLENCELGNAAFRLNDGATFTIGNDGIWFASMPVGSYTLTEVAPHQATSPSFDVELGEITTVIVVNNEDEGEGPSEETVEVSIMKHMCAAELTPFSEDVTTVAAFEAIEAAAAAANPGNPFAPLVATVLACPTIVLTANVPTAGAVSGGQIDFEFSVLDASGTQLLSEDGMFMQGAICEDFVGLDANGDGEITADVCLDVSHYSFEVVDGLVVITETEVPAGSTGLGTIRFTPGSGDELAVVGDIEDVETTGVIVLDTRLDPDNSGEGTPAEYGDDVIMVHAYNFAEAGEAPNEGEQPSGGRPTTGEGVLGGNPLPNTAISPTPNGSVPAALLALLMLSGLGAAAYAVKAEVRRRR